MGQEFAFDGGYRGDPGSPLPPYSSSPSLTPKLVGNLQVELSNERAVNADLRRKLEAEVTRREAWQDESRSRKRQIEELEKAQLLRPTEPPPAPKPEEAEEPYVPKVGDTVWCKHKPTGPYVVVQQYESHEAGPTIHVLMEEEKGHRIVTMKDPWIVKDKKGEHRLIPGSDLTNVRPRPRLSLARTGAFLLRKREHFAWALVAAGAAAALAGLL